MNTPPVQDPNLGTLTPEYARWALVNLAHAEYVTIYGKDKEQMEADHPQLFPKEWVAQHFNRTTGSKWSKPEIANPPEPPNVKTLPPPVNEDREEEPNAETQEESRPPAQGESSQGEAVDSVPAEEVEEQTEPEPQESSVEENVDQDSLDEEFNNDLKSLHHKSFQAKYGFSKKGYRAKTRNP